MTATGRLGPTASPEARAAHLLADLPLVDKAGLMFQQMVALTPDGDPTRPTPAFSLPSISWMIRRRHMTHFNVLAHSMPARTIARWYNAVQTIAAEHHAGIPVTIASDPRNSFIDNPAVGMRAEPFSQWPEPLGLAAIGDPELVGRHADMVRREYLAVGIRVALHPQADLATEPRWARCAGTFGEDADLAADLVAAYVRGFQTEQLGPDSVACMTKHFPGAGPQADGEDPHFDYGKDQVYPGGRFDYHLRPFRAAIAAGTSQIMPYYGRPIGTEYPEVGFAFNRGVLTGLLREKLGFTGIVCTDWTVLTDATILGEFTTARAWGLEDHSRPERIVAALEAGVDQFGGELCPQELVALVRSGRVSEDRVDASALRLLTEKFRLGLFDDPFVDVEAADGVVGCAEFCAAGLEAQRRSVTVLTNREVDAPLLPLGPGLRVHAPGVDPAVLARYATPVDAPEAADVALLRIETPHEPRRGGFAEFFHAGSLDFAPEALADLLALCRAVPTVLDVRLERPAILTSLVEEAAALVGTYGACDEALCDVLFGRSAPTGRLPFDLPRSMDAVRASREDTPFDTADPLFRFGHGLSW